MIFSTLKHILIVGVIATFCSSLEILSAQVPEKYKNSVSLAISLYDSAFAYDPSFINGRAHTRRYPQAKGHPFYGETVWYSGYLETMNGRYESLPIKFDLFNHLILLQHLDESGIQYIELSDNPVIRFSIPGHVFINAVNDQVLKNSDLKGFVEVITYQPIGIFIQWKKELRSGAGINAEYVIHGDYYLSVDNNSYKIARKKDLLNIFPMNRKSIRKFIRKQGFILSTERPEDFRKIAEFCLSL